MLAANKRLCKIEVTTPIQCGGKDTWVTIKYTELLRNSLPNAKLIVYPELSHVIMEEEPRAPQQMPTLFSMKQNADRPLCSALSTSWPSSASTTAPSTPSLGCSALPAS